MVEADDSLRNVLARCAASIRRTWPEHVPLYVCTTLFALSTAILVVEFRLPFPLGSGLFFLSTIGELILLIGASAALRHLFLLSRRGRPDNPLTIMLQQLVNSAVDGDRIGNMFHGLVTFTPLMMIFAALKVDIALLHPFAWDKTFMQLGTAMAFGHSYWQLLQPFLGYPPITTFFSFAYGAWFPLMFGCLFWQLSRRQSERLRSQFLLAFALAWFFGGFVIATIFSSAGPCFYGHVVHGPNPYEPLLHYLRQTRAHWPVWTVDAQDRLWTAYLTGVGDVQGISAMPSMHVTMAVLMTLLTWRVHPGLGIVFGTFAFIIALSAIMLGWHYAADTIGGLIQAVLFWKVSGYIGTVWHTYYNRKTLNQPELEPVPVGMSHATSA